ncbi:unnamed protein product [Parnassius apollo]|uniref:(apollo) hypothetical protein n=1 Tax=Parnassius apollo TaxID=110799 RepID=A0A8S3WZE7_PARAO|nr:unnamed protein product [Parnassius apollo]
MSETKRKGSGTEELPGGTLAIWSGVPESENACQGVGVLLSSRGADWNDITVITRFRGLFAGWRYRTAVTEPQSVCRIRSWKLQEADTRDKYHTRVAEKLDTIDGRKECVERTWQNLRDGMVSAAEEVCGTTKRGSSKRRDAWWNDEVREAVKKEERSMVRLLGL